jgi:aryl-alcohol dehydrogenase-like predicted oxidoreductase
MASSPDPYPHYVLGTWSLGGDYYHPQSHGQSKALIQAALASGIRRFDSAPVYGRGQAELLLGQAVRDYQKKLRPHKVKTVRSSGERGGADNDQISVPPHTLNLQFSSKVFAKKPAAIRSSLEKTLKRLALQRLDCFFLHWPSQDGNLEESWETILSLKKEGLVKQVGLSNISREEVQKLITIGTPDLLQRGLNLLFRHEVPWMKELSEQGIQIQAYSPLCQGLLGPNYLEKRPQDGRQKIWHFNEPHFSAIQKALKSALSLLGLEGTDLPGIALSWLKSQKWLSGIILGPRSALQLSQLLDLDARHFSPQTLEELERQTAFLLETLGDRPHLFARHKL